MLASRTVSFYLNATRALKLKNACLSWKRKTRLRNPENYTYKSNQKLINYLTERTLVKNTKIYRSREKKNKIKAQYQYLLLLIIKYFIMTHKRQK